MSSIRLALPEKLRLIRLARNLTIALFAGLIYAWIASRFGGLPCVFRLITGLKCPGCGVTHMCLRLLKGDLYGAFRENGAVLCLLPVGALLLVTWGVSYVKTGSSAMAPWQNRVIWCMVILLALFGLARNLAGFWGLTF